MSRTLFCQKLQKQAEGLNSPPWPGELGQRIYNEISQEAWQQWLRQQTILINEYKLSPLKAEDKQYLAAQMEAYLFGDGIVLPENWKQ